MTSSHHRSRMASRFLVLGGVAVALSLGVADRATAAAETHGNSTEARHRVVRAAGPSVCAPSSVEQPGMKVWVEQTAGRSRLVARLLERGQSCSAARKGTALPLRTWPRAARPSEVELRVVGLGPAKNRRVVLVEALQGRERWQAVIAAPLKGQGTRPRIVWEGRTPAGQSGKPPSVAGGYVHAASQQGKWQVTVGKVDPDIRVCGLSRPTVLAPMLVAARDLSLHPAMVERLRPTRDFERVERQKAKREQEQAASEEAGRQPSWTRLLEVVGASSAVGSPSHLTDGNDSTVWAEGGYRDGRWEFVTFRAPSQVPIRALRFVIRPPKGELPQAIAPRAFWITTDDRVIAVTMPEDAWKHPGAAYRVVFDEPVGTSCLSVVLDRGTSQAKGKRVTFAEVAAEPAVPVWKTPEEAVAALDGEDERAELAERLLRRGGEKALRAVAAGYGKLHEKGRSRAMALLDAAPCEVASWVWAPRLGSRWEKERKHAVERIRRCRRKAASALVSVIEKGPGCAGPFVNERMCKSGKLEEGQVVTRARLAAADELATVAPERAVEVLVPLLRSPKTVVRRDIRRFLARTVRHRQALGAWAEVLKKPDLPRTTVLDLLRSAHAGLRGPLLEAAKEAFSRLAAAPLDIDERYLACEPAAALAKAGDRTATEFLRRLMTSDPEPMVRHRAVTVSGEISGLVEARRAALADENVRVRVAAAKAESRDPAAASILLDRLAHDDWPMVRVAAAEALRGAAPTKEVLDRLAAGLEDRSPKVRLAVIETLGHHRATAYAPRLRELADAADEKVSLRMAAIEALGRMCDQEAVGMLTIFARRSADPRTPEAVSGLGRAAVMALGAIHPSDLRERLEPLLTNPRTPRYMKDLAEEVVSTSGQCRR